MLSSTFLRNPCIAECELCGEDWKRIARQNECHEIVIYQDPVEKDGRKEGCTHVVAMGRFFFAFGEHRPLAF